MIGTDPDSHQQRKNFKPRGFFGKWMVTEYRGEKSSILIMGFRVFGPLSESVEGEQELNDLEIVGVRMY
jgi:hypothetical protein